MREEAARTILAPVEAGRRIQRHRGLHIQRPVTAKVAAATIAQGEPKETEGGMKHPEEPTA